MTRSGTVCNIFEADCIIRKNSLRYEVNTIVSGMYDKRSQLMYGRHFIPYQLVLPFQ